MVKFVYNYFLYDEMVNNYVDDLVEGDPKTAKCG